jgi:uncharacterized membrane protein
MAGLAYLLLPVTGLIAYLTGASARVRFHGLQAIAIGLVWPVLLYAASIGTARLTQIVFAIGVVFWLIFLIGALIGRDPKIPGLWKPLQQLAMHPNEEGASTDAP